MNCCVINKENQYHYLQHVSRDIFQYGNNIQRNLVVHFILQNLLFWNRKLIKTSTRGYLKNTLPFVKNCGLCQQEELWGISFSPFLKLLVLH